MRFLPVSLTRLLVELADLDETLALFASLESRPLPGIESVVPAARTLMIRFRPDALSPETLAADLRERDLTLRPDASDRLVEVPVHYDGADLDHVAALAGVSRGEVIRRHAASTFTVAFTGFAPGFGYLVGGDPSLHVPRRSSPRTRIPAGSVALAGPFSGIYPRESPGGWQIIGRTPLALWDLARDPPALLRPGMRVRFTDRDAPGAVPAEAPPGPCTLPSIASADCEHGPPLPEGEGAYFDHDERGDRPETVSVAHPPPVDAPALGIRIRAAPIPALVQDLGRAGQTGQGVSVSGALDRDSLRAANRVVGNPTGTPCLEITLGGFRFAALGRITIALAGATCPITVRCGDGALFTTGTGRAVALEPGDVVELGHPPTGLRAYLAARGGFAVEPVLGSAATDTLAKIGPEPVGAGTVLGIRAVSGAWASVALDEPAGPALPARDDTVILDVVMGPRTDWFTPGGVATLAEQPWTVTPRSDRVGIRLAGAVGLERIDAAELPSEGTAPGAIQVPHDGQPVLFLADHPLTGGYPVIATVAEYHLALAGQIPVGARIRFRPIQPFGEIAPPGAV